MEERKDLGEWLKERAELHSHPIQSGIGVRDFVEMVKVGMTARRQEELAKLLNRPMVSGETQKPQV